MSVQGDSSSERSERIESLYGDTPGCGEEDIQVPESPGSAEIHPSSSLVKNLIIYFCCCLPIYVASYVCVTPYSIYRMFAK